MAKRRNANIIVLEYQGSGPTIPSIKNIIGNYSKVWYKTKYSDDGSDQVMEVITTKGLSRKIRLVGVNTDCCVYSTVSSLALRHKLKIDVAGDACNSNEDHIYGLSMLRDLPGVVVRRV
jgi:hypothetical protein